MFSAQTGICPHSPQPASAPAHDIVHPSQAHQESPSASKPLPVCCTQHLSASPRIQALYRIPDREYLMHPDVPCFSTLPLSAVAVAPCCSPTQPALPLFLLFHRFFQTMPSDFPQLRSPTPSCRPAIHPPPSAARSQNLTFHYNARRIPPVLSTTPVSASAVGFCRSSCTVLPSIRPAHGTYHFPAPKPSSAGCQALAVFLPSPSAAHLPAAPALSFP